MKEKIIKTDIFGECYIKGRQGGVMNGLLSVYIIPIWLYIFCFILVFPIKLGGVATVITWVGIVALMIWGNTDKGRAKVKNAYVSVFRLIDPTFDMDSEEVDKYEKDNDTVVSTRSIKVDLENPNLQTFDEFKKMADSMMLTEANLTILEGELEDDIQVITEYPEYIKTIEDKERVEAIIKLENALRANLDKKEKYIMELRDKMINDMIAKSKGSPVEVTKVKPGEINKIKEAANKYAVEEEPKEINPETASKIEAAITPIENINHATPVYQTAPGGGVLPAGVPTVETTYTDEKTGQKLAVLLYPNGVRQVVPSN